MSIEIVLKKSLIGASKRQIAVVESLGLKKIGDRKTQPENEATYGKIAKVSHFLQVMKEKDVKETKTSKSKKKVGAGKGAKKWDCMSWLRLLGLKKEKKE